MHPSPTETMLATNKHLHQGLCKKEPPQKTENTWRWKSRHGVGILGFRATSKNLCYSREAVCQRAPRRGGRTLTTPLHSSGRVPISCRRGEIGGLGSIVGVWVLGRTGRTAFSFSNVGSLVLCPRRPALCVCRRMRVDIWGIQHALVRPAFVTILDYSLGMSPLSLFAADFYRAPVRRTFRSSGGGGRTSLTFFHRTRCLVRRYGE